MFNPLPLIHIWDRNTVCNLHLYSYFKQVFQVSNKMEAHLSLFWITCIWFSKYMEIIWPILWKHSEELHKELIESFCCFNLITWKPLKHWVTEPRPNGVVDIQYACRFAPWVGIPLTGYSPRAIEHWTDRPIYCKEGIQQCSPRSSLHPNRYWRIMRIDILVGKNGIVTCTHIVAIYKIEITIAGKNQKNMLDSVSAFVVMKPE